jgi:hypothetical protein
MINDDEDDFIAARKHQSKNQGPRIASTPLTSPRPPQTETAE